ncbi:MAG: glycoside hydrolase family 127 protein [Firmicutes bacterium]|nr:glycoside hydrolase family 127 protein [Bacillota bacterium]
MKKALYRLPVCRCITAVIAAAVLLSGCSGSPVPTDGGTEETMNPKNIQTAVLPTAQQGGTDVKFSPLVPGEVQAASWLRHQLLLQAEYMTGQMELLSPDVKPDGADRSGWLGGSGESWERGAYYVRGLVSLAYVLKDNALIEKAQPWIEWVLQSQTESGCFGPHADDAQFDYWPLMPMLMALEEYADATGDERVIPFLEKYFAWQTKAIRSTPLSGWGSARGGDNIFAVLWLYEKTGDKSLLVLAKKLYNQTYDWEAAYDEDAWRGTYHIVNLQESFKLFPVMYALTGESKYLDIYYKGIESLYIAAGRADGMSNGDEVNRGIGATYGSETCAVVERMLCDEIALYITRDPSVADHLELVAYNALPQQYLPDMTGQVYFTMQNQIRADMGNHGFTSDGGDRSVYGFPGGFPCCAHNCHMGWPLFVASMWMRTSDGGLAVGAYGPCSVTTAAGGQTVTIDETTDYPFEDTVRLTVHTDKTVRFPLYVRIPEWCTDAQITVNGQAVPFDSTDNGYLCLTADWSDGDVAELVFPRSVRAELSQNNSVAVKYGALLFAVQICEKWEKIPYNPNNWNLTDDFPSWNITPTTAWNLALSGFDPTHPEDFFTVSCETPAADMTFRAENAPIVLTAAAVNVPDWTENTVTHTAGLLPVSPVKTAHLGTEQVTVRLIPYAFTRLRIALIPWTDGTDGTDYAYRAFADGTADTLDFGTVTVPDNTVIRPDGGYYGSQGSLVLKVSSPEDTVLSVTVNGSAAGTLNVKAGDNEFTLSPATLSSKKHNRVIIGTETGDAIVQGLSVVLQAETAAVPEVRYEAEHAVLTGGLYSSGTYVAGIDRQGDTLTFRVDTDKSGTYIMRVFYTDPMGPAKLDVAVDGIKAGELSFEWTATGWGTFDPDNFAELSVQLSAGTHTIEIIRPVSGGNSAELDAMTLMADTRGN